MESQTSPPDLAGLYNGARGRIAALVSGLTAAELSHPVPACPGWSVHDVVAHLTAITQDALAGTMAGIPTPQDTAAQVARFAGWDMGAMLAAWDENAAAFGEIIAAARLWRAVVDVTSHEHDIRGALGQPGARDSDAVWYGAGVMLRRVSSPVPLVITVEDERFCCGPGTSRGARLPGAPDPGEGSGLHLRTSRFEALRWRLGRRSHAQMAALAWSGDPSPVLGELAVFGPTESDIIE